MADKQPKALELAEWCKEQASKSPFAGMGIDDLNRFNQVAAELRRLHAENERLRLDNAAYRMAHHAITADSEEAHTHET